MTRSQGFTPCTVVNLPRSSSRSGNFRHTIILLTTVDPRRRATRIQPIGQSAVPAEPMSAAGSNSRNKANPIALPSQFLFLFSDPEAWSRMATPS